MNAFINAFVITVKRHVRSVTPLIMQVLAPIVMIIVFGSILKNNFSTGTFIDPLRVAIINEDKGEFSKQFLEFLNSSTMNKLLKVSSDEDLEVTKQLLKENEYDGIIEIKSNYSEEYVKGNYDGIEAIITNGDNKTYQILSSLLNGWKNNSSAIQIGLKGGMSMDAIIATLKNSNKIIIEKPLSEDGSLPKAIDYFSVTMIVMTLIFSGFNALGRIQEDFFSDMKFRFESAPTHMGYLLTGELLGSTCMSYLQSVFVVAFTHFVYGANWGNNWGVVLGTLFLLTLFGQMLAGALALGLKNADAPQAIIGSLAMGLEFLAGGFYTSPIKGSFGKFLLTYGTPNSLAQTAIFGSIYGGSSQIIFMCMFVLAALSLLLLSLTIVFARRRVL
jgi:ABC-2 type transport system permease protein